MGASRVGCFPCINSAKLEIRAMARYRPERIDFIALQENSFDNDSGFSSFFARKTVPESFRSRAVITSTGETVMVPTIRDVVDWSRTRKNRPNYYELDLDLPPASACDIGGYCE